MTRTKSTYLALVAVLMSPMAANADLITVGGTTYDLTTVTGSYSQHAALLQAQVWWGNVGLANQLAAAAQYQLGRQTWGSSIGALFATSQYRHNSGYARNSIWHFNHIHSNLVYGAGSTRNSLWAVATAVPEPGTLALLGLGLVGLGFTRRRREV